LVAAIIEANHDKNGIIWPSTVAPFSVAIITTDTQNAKVERLATSLYTKLLEAGVDVLWDDREERAGVKFSDMDLIGIPYQIIIGTKAAEGEVFELKDRRTNARQDLSFDEVVNRFIAK
jgi:prolyl-tRNA synthetase